jgi:hypothetical protein
LRSLIVEYSVFVHVLPSVELEYSA